MYPCVLLNLVSIGNIAHIQVGLSEVTYLLK